MDIGNQIKMNRKKIHLSQNELAEKIYVSSQTISNWENERSYPTLDNLIALSVLFDTSLDILVKGDIDMMKTTIEKSSMTRYSWMMLVLLLVGAFSIGPVIKYFDYFGLLISGVIILMSLFYSLKVDKIKRKYNLTTYKEIVSFLENKENKHHEKNKNKELIESLVIVLAFIIITVSVGKISLELFIY